METDWSDEAFKTRVSARASEIGKSVRQVLTDAGIAHDTLGKVPSAGRRVDTLAKIAKALDWSLPQVMGFYDIDMVPVFQGSFPKTTDINALPAKSMRVSIELMELAFAAARRGLRMARLPPEEEDAALPALTARIYNILANRRDDGLPIDENFRDGLSAMIADEWQKNS